MSSSKSTERGLGLAAAVPEEVVRAAALAVQDNGYHSFWLNNPPGTHALERLGEVARVAADIWLGVGVIPLANHRPGEIVQEVRRNDLPLSRFYLGIGSGGGPGGVERVREGIGAIRSELGCQLVVAAMGPRMCRLAGEAADGVLFNWLTPEYARRSTDWVREGAESAARPLPRLMAYVRVALGDAALLRLQREAGNYEAIPHYAAHFKRMGTPAMGTAITGATPQDIQQGLAGWDRIVDEVVVRAITANDTVEEVTQLLEAARPEG
jgi:alkanesulfonate monooxygenase SsuD/methylene tetrahydromethanopterin reductase-like flavin-dependent oxidoreductase (luciferase family)